MYFKLMVRSLLRHQKRGRRLFVLLALCSAALIFLLTFQADFGRQYRDLFIGMTTGHLQVLPSQAAIFSDSAFGARDQDVPTLRVTPEFDRWVRSQPEVEEAAPQVARFGMAFNLDSEVDSWISIVAVPAERRNRLFPLATAIDGNDQLAWKPGDSEVPVLHARLQSEFGERNNDHSRFYRFELKAFDDTQMDEFKKTLQSEFPSLFGTASLAGPGQDQVFLDLWSKALSDPNLEALIPGARLDHYDYQIDDALTALHENKDPTLLSFLRKRLFLALYPDHIFPLRQPIVPGKSVTLQVPGLHSEGALDLPKVIPVRYAGMGEILPLYTPNSWIDLEAFRYYMGMAPELATSYVIRLKNAELTEPFQKRLQTWLDENPKTLGTVRVADYHFLGKLYLTTGLAFDVIIGILIGVFVLILVVFITNLVLMSMIQRRREIGTSVAMGLTNTQNIVVMTGEVGVIVTVSWVAGSLLAMGFVLAAHLWGIPGMIFFPGQRLYLTLQASPYLWSLALLLPAALLAAVIPLSGLRRFMPVDFFREAH